MAGNTGNGALGDRALPRNHRQTGSLRGRAGSPSTPLRMKSCWILTSVRGDSVTRTRDAGVVRREVGGVVAGDTSDPVEPFRVSRSSGVPAAGRTRRDAASTGRVMRKGRPGTWPPRQRLTAPRQTLPALRGGRATRPNAGARDCAPPAMAGTHGAPQRSTNPATTGCPAAATGIHSRANPEANGAAIRVGDAS